MRASREAGRPLAGAACLGQPLWDVGCMHTYAFTCTVMPGPCGLPWRRVPTYLVARTGSQPAPWRVAPCGQCSNAGWVPGRRRREVRTGRPCLSVPICTWAHATGCACRASWRCCSAGRRATALQAQQSRMCVEERPLGAAAVGPGRVGRMLQWHRHTCVCTRTWLQMDTCKGWICTYVHGNMELWPVRCRNCPPA